LLQRRYQARPQATPGKHPLPKQEWAGTARE
jgi:hypothetical protein